MLTEEFSTNTLALNLINKIPNRKINQIHPKIVKKMRRTKKLKKMRKMRKLRKIKKLRKMKMIKKIKKMSSKINKIVKKKIKKIHNNLRANLAEETRKSNTNQHIQE
jgi:hypothetical protein